MKEFPHEKLVIHGNHEVAMERGPKRKECLKFFDDAGINYLQDSGIEINGIKFYGSPVTPTFFNWEYNRNRGPDIKHHWDMIPDDTNVLITHGPAYGILDSVRESFRGPQGCQDLKNRINQLSNLKAHIFGHMHHNGHQALNINGIQFINAAICTDDYSPDNLPMIIDL